MNIFALLAFAGFFLSGFSNGLYIHKRESLPRDVPPETVPEISSSNGNDEGSAAGFNTPVELPPLLSPTEGQNTLDDFLKSLDISETQADAGTVDDSKGDAGTLTPGGKSGSPEGAIVAGASVPIPDTPLAESSWQDKTQEQGSQDLTGTAPGLIASTVGVGLQGQDLPSESAVNSDSVNNGLIIGNGDIDQTLALAFADLPSSSGKSGAQLTDPLFANSNIPSLKSGLSPGSIFASASTTGDGLFLDSVSDLEAAPPNGGSTQASVFSPDDATNGGDGNGNSNPNSQDESFLRNNPDTVDWDDPCNLMHGSDTPFFQCTLTTSRTVLAPFKIPSVPRPDNDIAVDDVADVP